METETPIKLKIPKQDLHSFDLFHTDISAAQEWVRDLPMADPKVVAQKLLSAVSELNRYSLPPEQRFAILESLASKLNVTLTNLNRHFLNQPLVMPEEPRQLAKLTDALQGQFCTAYSIVAAETLAQRDNVRDTNPAKLVCEATQRALHFAGLNILLTFQLNQPVASSGWLTLHQLYSLAEHQGLSSLPVNTQAGAVTTINASYLQSMLLGCCKPNQLRQSDLAAVKGALDEWSDQLQISPTGSPDSLFLVDLQSDQPPIYSSLGNAGNGQCRHIDTGKLINHLKQQKALDDDQGKSGLKLKSGLTLPANMLSHMIDALGNMSMRNFNRVRANAPLAVSIGLGAAHFRAAGERNFGKLLYGDDYLPEPSDRVATNPFLQTNDSDRDAWSQAKPEEDYVREQAVSEIDAALTHNIDLDENTRQAIEEFGPNVPEDPEVPVYQVELANVSPGGYCLNWCEDLPREMRAGNIVAVQEEHSDSWAIAVIRWVSALQDSHTLVGLELLSPRSTAYGAQAHKKTGALSEPQRVLLLPKIQLVGQPHTLITPRAGFREQQKVSLLRHGEKSLVQLTRQISSTASYAQFDFRYIKQVDGELAEKNHEPLDAPFDSLWNKI